MYHVAVLSVPRAGTFVATWRSRESLWIRLPASYMGTADGRRYGCIDL
ncbi:hypothetical protein HMPREF9445_02312 [Bacteroides clarus YIT 12056]|uniref:Uncharacterized protein n=1 Tax=Bacteroides clarus YIT 12056 TaxID=762984 RepID=A0ABN0CLF8_9BACE|nr:hypothetical protein HMPREF9445_02312 [Bacteroides clarus YIT 12056]